MHISPPSLIPGNILEYSRVHADLFQVTPGYILGFVLSYSRVYSGIFLGLLYCWVYSEPFHLTPGYIPRYMLGYSRVHSELFWVIPRLFWDIPRNSRPYSRVYSELFQNTPVLQGYSGISQAIFWRHRFISVTVVSDPDGLKRRPRSPEQGSVSARSPLLISWWSRTNGAEPFLNVCFFQARLLLSAFLSPRTHV